MKIVLIQPKLEKTIGQIADEMHNHPDADILVFPEGYLNENVEEACSLAKRYRTIFIGGYRRLQEQPKDRALIINRAGEIVLDRVKYSETVFVREEGLTVGILLCDELIKMGLSVRQEREIDLIVHPIGVGMYSEEQFEEWIREARRIAVSQQVMIIGASHADGSFRGSDVSIPIAYAIDKEGEALFIAKNDVRTRILDFRAKSVTV